VQTEIHREDKHSFRRTKPGYILHRIKPDNQVAPANGRQYVTPLGQRVFSIIKTMEASAILLCQAIQLIFRQQFLVYNEFFLAGIGLWLVRGFVTHIISSKERYLKDYAGQGEASLTFKIRNDSLLSLVSRTFGC
jgi:hypothetical protein